MATANVTKLDTDPLHTLAVAVDTDQFQTSIGEFFTAHDVVKNSAIRVYMDIDKADDQYHAENSESLWSQFPVPKSEEGNNPDIDPEGGPSWYERFFCATTKGKALKEDMRVCKEKLADKTLTNRQRAELTENLALHRERVKNAVALIRKAVSIYQKIDAINCLDNNDNIRAEVSVTTNSKGEKVGRRERKPIIIKSKSESENEKLTIERFLSLDLSGDKVNNNYIRTDTLEEFLDDTKPRPDVAATPLSEAEIETFIADVSASDDDLKALLAKYMHDSKVTDAVRVLIQATKPDDQEEAA